jgi:hypothetical protein
LNHFFEPFHGGFMTQRFIKLSHSSSALTLVSVAFFIALVSGCGSHPIKPAAENIKISRDDADKDCREIGSVEGRNQSAKGTFETALEDLKLDAARQGANYVRMEQTSGTGTAVRGTAYLCP